MPRSQMGLSLFDEAVRIWGPGRGSVAIRDYTATGLKQAMFPGKYKYLSAGESGGSPERPQCCQPTPQTKFSTTKSAMTRR